MRILLILFLSITILSSCKKDDADPCKNLTATSADFKITQSLETYDINNNPIKITKEVNTVYKSATVDFTALNDGVSYKFKVGTDTREWTEKSFFLSFPNEEDNIPITLSVINNSVNNDCFPWDDGLDTMTKYINVIASEWPWLGEYEGYFEHDSNTLRLIKLRSYGIIGISGVNCHPNDTVAAYRSANTFGFSISSGTCLEPYGVGLYENDVITLSYHEEIYGPSEERVSRKFTGTRVK